MNLPHRVSVCRLTGDGQYLVQSLRAGVARCRLCGCTEERACPGGCFWVRDPEMGDLYSARDLNPRPTGSTEAGIAL
jgi:hypothetical protein